MPLPGACCKFDRREPVEARVRSVGVVVDPPFFDDLTRLIEVGKQVLVQALVAQSAVKAFDEGIIVAVTRSTHGRDQAMLGQDPAVSGARELHAAIGVDDEGSARLTLA